MFSLGTQANVSLYITYYFFNSSKFWGLEDKGCSIYLFIYPAYASAQSSRMGLLASIEFMI